MIRSWMGVLHTGQFLWFLIHLAHETMCLQGWISTSLSALQQMQQRLLLGVLFCKEELLSCWTGVLSPWTFWTSYMAEFPILKVSCSFKG